MPTTFVSINGTSIALADALRALFFNNPEVAKNLVRDELLRQHAARLGVALTDQELQVAADEMRYARELESADKLDQWLKQNHQTHQSLVAWLEMRLLGGKVRHTFTDDQIAAYYAEHQLDFEYVTVQSCRTESAAKAEEILELLKDGTPFPAVAAAHSTDTDTAGVGGWLGPMSRKDVTPELESVLFGADPGPSGLIGPVQTKEGYNVFRVSDRQKPTLDDLKDGIRFSLLDELLDKLEATATVEFPSLQAAAGVA